MPKKRKSVEDPVTDFGILLALLSFFLMIGYANPFNPLPFLVSIVGFLAGLYIIALRVYPKEAKYFRESLLQKIDFLFNWSKETVQKTREKRKRKKEEIDEEKDEDEC